MYWFCLVTVGGIFRDTLKPWGVQRFLFKDDYYAVDQSDSFICFKLDQSDLFKLTDQHIYVDDEASQIKAATKCRKQTSVRKMGFKESKNMAKSNNYLQISKLKGSWRFSNNFRGLFQCSRGFLLTLCSNNLKIQTAFSNISCWGYFQVSNLRSGLPGSLSLCSHSTLQLNWQTSIFTVKENNTNRQKANNFCI